MIIIIIIIRFLFGDSAGPQAAVRGRLSTCIERQVPFGFRLLLPFDQVQLAS